MESIFPIWVPVPTTDQIDVEFNSYGIIENSGLDAQRVFIESPFGEKVWATIKKRTKEECHWGVWVLFMTELGDAAIDLPSDFWDLTSMNARDKHIEKVLAATERLKALVKEFEEYDDEVFFFKYGFTNPLHINGIKYEDSTIAEKTKAIQAKYRDQSGYQPVGMSEILETFTGNVSRLKRVEGLITKQPNAASDASMVYCIRRLHQFFNSSFETPLDETVAKIVKIFFDRDIDRDLVRSYRRKINIRKLSPDDAMRRASSERLMKSFRKTVKL